jgi:hypothetical protein
MKKLNDSLMFINVVGYCFVAGAAILLCSKGLLALALVSIAFAGYGIPKLAKS